MPREDVIVKPGYEYDHYFPKARLITVTKKKGAKVEDTLRLIPAVIRETAEHTRRFALEVIQADTLEESCRRLWHFVYQHIAYRKDEEGKEQVRSPARTWHDRHNKGPDGKPMGVDCDCMTVFIVSVLYNLEVKNIFFRITKYEQKHFEHIYPIVILPGGRQITIDCVTHYFNYETPYKAKQDTPMDLEYLNGVNDSSMERFTETADFLGIMEEHEAIAELGKIFQKKKAAAAGAPAPAKKPLLNIKKPVINIPKPVITIKKPVINIKQAVQTIKKPVQAVKKVAQVIKKPLVQIPVIKKLAEKKDDVKKALAKGLHVTNRINPVTVALRNGLLAGMKLNFMQIGSNLRWTYLNEEEAVKQGADRERFRKLKAVREKLDSIFHGAGGLVQNLKKAILTGKGNSDKGVPMNGLGSINLEGLNALHEDMTLSQLLGHDIYYSENVDGRSGTEVLQGFGSLGSATAASVAAASTALTAIAGLIKTIGDVFPKRRNASGSSASTEPANTEQGGGSPPAEPSGSETNPEAGSGSSPGAEPGGDAGSSGSGTGQPEAGGTDTGGGSGDAGSGSSAGDAQGDAGGSGAPATSASKAKATATAGALKVKAKAFWESNKKVLKPTVFIVGTLGLLYLTYRLLRGSKKEKPKAVLSGLPKKKVKRSAQPFSGLKAKPKQAKKSKRKYPKKKSISLL